MTFTYAPSASPSDKDKVRYHISDTDEDSAIFSDEEIAMVLAMESNNIGKTVISLINSIVAKLSHEPDMTADWLTISWRRSSDAWRALLAEKRKAFGLGFTMSTTQVDAYRKDSLQRPADGQTTYTPDYSDDRGTDYSRRTGRDDEPIWE